MIEDTPRTITRAPRFCRDCGRAAEGPESGTLCTHCGGTLRVQGYCPICEARLRRPVGDPCPKHDIELLAEDPDDSAPATRPSSISWVTVKRFPDTLAAAGARIRLDAEGIPTFLEGERMGAPAMYRVATGGVKLQVPAEMAADARIILDQSWSWPDDELGIDDEPDPTVDEGMEESGIDSPRRLLIELIVTASLAIPLLVVLWHYLHGGG